MRARFIEVREKTSIFGRQTLGSVLGYGKGQSHLFHLFTLKQPFLPLNQSLEALLVSIGTITQAISEANVSAQNIVGGLSGIHKQISGIFIRSSLFLGTIFTDDEADQYGAFVGMTNSISPLRESLYLAASADRAYTQITEEGLVSHAGNAAILGALEDAYEDQIATLDYTQAWQINEGGDPVFKLFRCHS